MWISRCLPTEPFQLLTFSINKIADADYGSFVFLRLLPRYNNNSSADTAFLALKTVKSLHNNNSLLGNSRPFHNSKVNNLRTQTNKAVETTVEMVLSTPRDSLWRL